MKKLMIKHKSKILILTILMIIVIFTFILMIFYFEKSSEDIQLKSQTSPQNIENNIAQLIEVGTLSQKSAIPTTVISASITFNNITTTCFLLKDGRKLCKVGTIKVSSGDVEDIDVIIRGGGS